MGHAQPATRRRVSDNPHQITGRVYYDDVRVGTIGERVGVADGSVVLQTKALLTIIYVRYGTTNTGTLPFTRTSDV